MSATARFEIDPRIVHQTIDGEVVVIDLESGCYYSLSDVAADVWRFLEHGAGPGEMAEALAARYGMPPDAVRGAIEPFVGQLRDEALIVVADGAAGHARVTPTGTFGSPPRGPFSAPVLHKYTDMKDLLQIDPIHEVGDVGWPGPAKGDGRG